MKTKLFATLSLILIAMTILSACSGAQPAAPAELFVAPKAEPAAAQLEMEPLGMAQPMEEPTEMAQPESHEAEDYSALCPDGFKSTDYYYPLEVAGTEFDGLELDSWLASITSADGEVGATFMVGDDLSTATYVDAVLIDAGMCVRVQSAQENMASDVNNCSSHSVTAAVEYFYAGRATWDVAGTLNAGDTVYVSADYEGIPIFTMEQWSGTNQQYVLTNFNSISCNPAQ